MLSAGMFSALAAAMAPRSRGLPSGSPPPDLAAMVISLMRRVKILPRLASVAPFLCLIVAHFEWPDMYYLGGDFAWARAELRACATLRSYHVDERFEELVRAERSFGGWLLWIFWLVFFWRGAGGVLQGFLRILWCSVMVNRGEVVVDCVVNVA